MTSVPRCLRRRQHEEGVALPAFAAGPKRRRVQRVTFDVSGRSFVTEAASFGSLGGGKFLQTLMERVDSAEQEPIFLDFSADAFQVLGADPGFYLQGESGGRSEILSSRRVWGRIRDFIFKGSLRADPGFYLQGSLEADPGFYLQGESGDGSGI